MKISKSFGQKKTVRNIFLSITFLFLMLSGYSLYWYLVAGKIINSIEEKKGEYLIEGYRIETSSINISGFPFWFNTIINEPSISRFNETLSWSWRGPKLIISSRPWQLQKIEVKLSGRYIATLKTQRRSLDTDLTIGNSNIFLKWNTNSNFPTKARVKIKDVLFSTTPILGLGRKTKNLDFQIEATGSPPNSFASSKLASWRNQGGVLKIQNIFFEHGPIEIRGDGTLALNKELQPLAAFSFEVSGYLELIDRLQLSRLISLNEARLARAILSMLTVSKKNEENKKSKKKVKFPLTIQDGYLYVGPLSLGRIPEFHWPYL
jgi:hypothetical protein